MGVLGGCFCSGGGKSERLKATIFSNKGPAMAHLSSSTGDLAGSGFLMHRNLLLTTHVNLPSAMAAEATEVRLQNDALAALAPNRFFITSSVLDLTIVGLDTTEGDSNCTGPQPHQLKTYSNPNLDLGSVVYVLGYTANKELTIDEGRVVIATDNLIKLSTQGVNWSPGCAGFDSQGNLAFMICDPMKLATSPYTRPAVSTSSPSSKRDRETLFGIPMPIICEWLNQHLEPKEILMRSVSDGHLSEHPGASSLITNQVYANNEAEDLNDSSAVKEEEKKAVLESPKATTIPKKNSEISLLDIESDPKTTAVPKENTEISILNPESDPIIPRREDEESISSNGVQNDITQPQEKKNTVVESAKATAISNETSEIPLGDIKPDLEAPEEISSSGSTNGIPNKVECDAVAPEEISSSGSANGIPKKVGSSPTHEAGTEVRDEIEKRNSDVTAESRSNSSPREGQFKEPIRSYNRWAVHRYAHRSLVETNLSWSQPRKSVSQGGTSRRSSEYSTPTVSSVKKKRNANLEKAKPASKPMNTARKTAANSPRWVI